MITEPIKQIVRSMLTAAHLLCVVDSVDKENSTCSVTPVHGGASIPDVRLRATINNEIVGVLVYPEVGTVVSVGVIDLNLSNCFVAAIERFEECLITLEGAIEFRLNRDQVLLKSNNVELGDEGGEPVVKGDTLNVRIGELIDILERLNNNLIQLATTQQAVSQGPLAALAPGFAQAIANLTQLIPEIAAIQPKLEQHLSQKVTTR